MKLVKVLPDRGKKGSPAICVSKSGYFRFSRSFVIAIGLSKGSAVAIYQDSDSPRDWYLKPEAEGDLVVRPAHKDDGSLIGQCSSLARKLLASVSTDGKTATMPVATSPIDGGYYAILTKGLKTKN